MSVSAFELAAREPWLIEREALETVLSVAQRYGDPEAVQAKLGRPLDNSRSVTVRDGVAVIPVTGPIFRYANLFTAISGATSTGVLAQDIQSAIENPYIKAIVLEINSPGGQATGINELAKLIHAGTARKRIVAYGEGSVSSAAYWLASACTEIVVDDIASLGSIGVVMSFLDTRKRDEKADVRKVEIVSSQSPDKRIDPSSDEGRAKVQAQVDALADVFVEAVATYRHTRPEKVLSDFGRGGSFIGKAAVKAGMADRIGSLESVIAELAGSASTSHRTITMSQSKTGQVTVASTDDLRNALAAGYTADQITFASNDAAIAQARAEGEATGKAALAEAVAAGAKAERERVLKLQSLAGAGFAAELNAALENGTTPETFAVTLLEAAKDRGITLDAITRAAPPAASHARPGEGARPAWDSVIAKFGGK